MQYVYDIIVNFSKDNLIDFYEWENKDNITHLKKVPIFKIKKTLMNDILNNTIIVDKSFFDIICLKTECDCDNKKNISLFTDSRTIIAVCFNNDGEIILKSFLLIEDEIDILNITVRLKEINIEYKIISKKSRGFIPLTRKEQRINKFITSEINNLLKLSYYDRINYYYYEYFNKQMDEINANCQSLLTSINNNFDDRNLKLYDIIKLSYQNNN